MPAPPYNYQRQIVDDAGNVFGTQAFDGVFGNVEGIALASAARTATINGPDIINTGSSGIVIFLNVTVASGTGGLTLRIQGKDVASGSYASMNAAPTAIIATGMTLYTLYPSTALGAQANNGPLPRTFRIIVTHGDASSYTYSVGYSLVR